MQAPRKASSFSSVGLLTRDMCSTLTKDCKLCMQLCIEVQHIVYVKIGHLSPLKEVITSVTFLVKSGNLNPF